MSQILDWIKDAQTRQHLAGLIEERIDWLNWKPFEEIKTRLTDLPHREAQILDFSQGTVVIGEALDDDDPHRQQIMAAAKAILPWKKGPYSLFGIDIDAEWRCDHKWDRLADFMPSLTGKRILDIGCNNGYFMFRMLNDEPEFVLGVDPVPRLWYQFHLLQRFAQISNIEFQMLGWEETAFFHELFDIVFNMGIFYHHFNPVQMLKNMRQSLRPGGTLVLESIIIPGEESICLFPPDRYANMRNVWLVPTVTAMVNFLERTNFEDIQIVSVTNHTPDEQRTTAWNPGPSFKDFLKKGDATHTIEGHPAPKRAILTAKRARHR